VTPPLEEFYPTNVENLSVREKACKICRVVQPIDNFDKYNNSKIRRKTCKSCRNAQREKAFAAQKFYAPITVKICAMCKLEKPVNEFAKYSKGKHGLHSYCKSCKLADDRSYAAKREEKNKEQRRLDYMKMEPHLRPQPKLCSNSRCILSGTLQPPENFHKSRIHKTGLLPDCKVCEKERKRLSAERHKGKVVKGNKGKYKDDQESVAYHKRWYEEHKDVLNKRTKEWRDSNPEECRRLHIERRFRQYGVTIEWYNEQLALQNGKCAICGGTDTKNPHGTFHVDHRHDCCSKSCHACDNCRRGLLCSSCNTRLGILENLVWKKQAIAYLNKYSKKPAVDVDQGSLFDF